MVTRDPRVTLVRRDHKAMLDRKARTANLDRKARQVSMEYRDLPASQVPMVLWAQPVIRVRTEIKARTVRREQ
jgi:hypothetical protein